MRFAILDRVTGAVLTTADIPAAEEAPYEEKLGLAARWAIHHGADLRGADLRGADLRGADLSGATLSGATLCRADLSGATLRGAALRGADLSGADLCGATLSGATLSGADLCGADLCGADLCGATLSGATLSGATLSGADLCGADLCGATLCRAAGGDIPVIPHIDATILAAIDTAGNALDMRRWHTCATTHCRAGWAIVLAGRRGHQLEDALGPSTAGALIYAASRPGERVPNFHGTTADTLADLRAHAARDPLPTGDAASAYGPNVHNSAIMSRKHAGGIVL